MAIVFDEILSEVHTPSTDRDQINSPTGEDQASSGIASQAELQQTLERIKIRRLRLMAD